MVCRCGIRRPRRIDHQDHPRIKKGTQKRNARESRAIVLEHAGQFSPNYVKPEGKAWSIITHASVGWSSLEWLRRKTRHYQIACRASELRLLVPCCGKVRFSIIIRRPPRR